MKKEEKIEVGDLVAEYIEDWYLTLITDIGGDDDIALGHIIDQTEYDNEDDMNVLKFEGKQEKTPWDAPIKLDKCIMIQKGHMLTKERG